MAIVLKSFCGLSGNPKDIVNSIYRQFRANRTSQGLEQLHTMGVTLAMLWGLAKEGSCAVQDSDGNWIGTFKDSDTAVYMVNKHNSNELLNNANKEHGSQLAGWGKSSNWN